MDRYSSEQIRSIAARALEIDPTQRQGFIVSACCDDPEAVRAVLEWIRLSQNAGTASSTATVELGSDYRRPAGKHRFSPGDIIDNRLKIIEYVNEGGMGEVYAALDLNLGETLALKAIRSDIAGLSGTIERFKTEVKQSLRITHPNVCRVHQIASHWDREGRLVWFLTMELLEGPTLARCLDDDGAIPPDRALALIKQMVSGLACAHQAGIVHRDLKPSNVMLVGSPPDERLVITDFGLAMSVSSRVESGVFGTPAYMAPEQLIGGAVGPQADVFAFGIIICEMLTGDRPVLDLKSAENCSKQLKAWFSLHPKLPPSIVPIVKHCLQFSPGDRFADAREIAPLLETKRRTAERVAIAVVLIAALIVLAGRLVSRAGERVVNEIKLTPEGAVSAEPSLSANGNYLAYTSNRADSANPDIWLQSIPTGDARRLTTSPAEDSYPSISPDGKAVAFRSERDGGGIYLIGSDGTGERLLAPNGRNPAFSPDGKSIAYWQGPEDTPRSGELYLYSLDHGPPRRLVEDFDDARYPTWAPDGHLLFFGCRSAGAGTRACPDWWAVYPNGGEPINTGVAALLRNQQMDLDFPPKLVWQRGHVLVSMRLGRTFHLWDILLSRTGPRAVGRPRQVTFADIDEKSVSSVENGEIALEHVSGALHLWRVPATRSANPSGPEKLTDSVYTDCCPAVSRDGRWVFFTRRLADVRQLMRLDLSSGKESMIYVSNEDKLWPLPNSNGDLAAFESRSGSQSSIVLWKQNVIRTLCNSCSHPSAWISDGRELLYTTTAGDIQVLDIVSGQSRIIVSANQGYVLSYPDWSPQNQHLLFTGSKGGVKRVFAAPLLPEGARTVDTWIPLTTTTETADLARWSADGKRFFYFSHRDGFYCLWESSFDAVSGTFDGAYPVQHYHDWGKGPSRTTPYVLGMSADEHWIYTNVGEASATIWQGRLQRDVLADYVRRVFEH